MGRQFFGQTGGGEWYSLASDDEGKYWRNAKIVKAVNQRCQSRSLDSLVLQTGKACVCAMRIRTGGACGCAMPVTVQCLCALCPCGRGASARC